MGLLQLELLEDDHFFEPNSTPKLSFSRPLYKPTTREPLQMPTPPVHPSLSIPFRWEVAPGKPRATLEDPPYTRCLDLPPRLLRLDDAKMTMMPSPTGVLDGPYVGRSLSLSCTFSFRKGPAMGREECGSFGSGRWGSFKEEAKAVRGSVDFSHSLGEMLKSEKSVKITTRVRKKRRMSFFNLTTMNYKMLDIYASFKEAVPIPWRRKRR